MQEFVRKKNLTETLRNMKVGSSMIIKNRDFKPNSGQAAKRKLKQEGIIIDITEAGMIDEWKATRLT